MEARAGGTAGGSRTGRGTPPSTARGTSANVTVVAADSASPANQTDPATLVLQVSPWTTTSLPSTDSVSCVSATFCMAVGSTDHGSIRRGETVSETAVAGHGRASSEPRW